MTATGKIVTNAALVARIPQDTISPDHEPEFFTELYVMPKKDGRYDGGVGAAARFSGDGIVLHQRSKGGLTHHDFIDYYDEDFWRWIEKGMGLATLVYRCESLMNMLPPEVQAFASGEPKTATASPLAVARDAIDVAIDRLVGTKEMETNDDVADAIVKIEQDLRKAAGVVRRAALDIETQGRADEVERAIRG